MNFFIKTFLRKTSILCFGLIHFSQYSLAQGPCDCTALNSTNLCNGGYFADHASCAAATPNPYIPGAPLSWSSGSYTFCTKYTPNITKKISIEILKKCDISEAKVSDDIFEEDG